MFSFINEYVPEELKNNYCHQLIFTLLRKSLLNGIRKAKTPRRGLNKLLYDVTNLWNKLYHVLLYKEPNLTKGKLKNVVKCIFWTLLLS